MTTAMNYRFTTKYVPCSKIQCFIINQYCPSHKFPQQTPSPDRPRFWNKGDGGGRGNESFTDFYLSNISYNMEFGKPIPEADVVLEHSFLMPPHPSLPQ